MAKNANNNYAQPAIPKFDGHYEHWALMENLLKSKEYWIVVEEGVLALPEPTQEQKKITEEGG